MLTDAGALGLALLAIWFAQRPATKEKTYGYYRAEILAAVVNAVVLLFISVYILDEAWRRFQNPPEVMSWPMLIVATIGLAVNMIGMRLLADASGKSLNVKGAYLEVLSDMLGSLGVIAASVIMLTTGWYLADPLISAGIGLFILPRTWTLLRQVTHILMEGTPAPH
jgi:cobalt-zinc-cadmium efflux system protein